MVDDAEYFRKQAAMQRADADASTLANVRERCERAATTWDKMAGQADRATSARNKREAEAAVARASRAAIDPIDG